MDDIFRTPDDRFASLPGWDFEPHYADVDGLRMHYMDEGSGRPVVCFHGEPTWAYLYRKLAQPLLDAGERVVAVDMPGFGRSDKPTEIGWYSYERHYEHVSAVLAGPHPSGAARRVAGWGGGGGGGRGRGKPGGGGGGANPENPPLSGARGQRVSAVGRRRPA